MNDAAVDDELFHWNLEAFPRPAEKLFAGGRRGQGQVAGVEIGGVRVAARRRALVGSPCRVALNQSNAIDRYRELLGDQLCLSRVETLPQLTLTRVGRNLPLCVDGDPRVELVSRHRQVLRRLRRRSQNLAHSAEADNQAAGPLQPISTRQHEPIQGGAGVASQRWVHHSSLRAHPATSCA